MGACTTPGNIQIVQEKLEIDLESKIHDPTNEPPLSQRMQWGKECAQGYDSILHIISIFTITDSPKEWLGFMETSHPLFIEI